MEAGTSVGSGIWVEAGGTDSDGDLLGVNVSDIVKASVFVKTFDFVNTADFVKPRERVKTLDLVK